MVETGNCPIAETYQVVSHVIPIVAKALQPTPSMKFKCLNNTNTDCYLQNVCYWCIKHGGKGSFRNAGGTRREKKRKNML